MSGPIGLYDANAGRDPGGDVVRAGCVPGDDPAARLKDLRVLIVEDEAIVSMLIEQIVEDFGCEVAATAARVSAGVELARDATFDLAVLDMNLAGQSIDPVVEVLIERDAPFVFSTGYGESAIPPAWRGRPVVTKPFMPVQLRDAMLKALERQGGLA